MILISRYPNGNAGQPSTRVRRLPRGVVPREQPQAASPLTQTISPNTNMFDAVVGLNTLEGSVPISSRTHPDTPAGPRTRSGPGVNSARAGQGVERDGGSGQETGQGQDLPPVRNRQRTCHSDIYSGL